ncbi:probable serine/threonine-protein kinase pats1 isoform X3 [Lepidochelys kempii]|uniref:probable serine/threonine-protein kinase pats1 isoform X3 n=1 Tax=Lepidochelys kempii TaxID=8472 RepID=UPI003C6ED464
MAQQRACQEQDDRASKVTLSTMRLRVLPPTVLQDPRMESLNLDRNKLKHVAGISKLGNLRKLILSKNEIADFPEEIQSLVHLEKLELNQNQIRVIPEGIFSCLPRLKHLRLSNNRLSALPKDLATCSSSLQYLNLSNNLFRAIPQAVLELVSLQELYVQNNTLRQLPRELFEGRPLKMFKANGNPLREPPNEVCAGGIQQILSYFSQLQNCHVEEDRRVKTMFLGASLAGKSTICKSLKQRQVVLVSEEERTVGIEISEFHIQDFTFLFWDFAGQLEYYVTHHVFITPQALVILVINFQKYQLNNGIFQELVGFWINNLFMRVPNSVVLPVGTHTDCCTEEEVEEKKRDIMSKIQAMLEERRANLAHFINNLESSEESEFYVDQWDRLKEMESCTLTILVRYRLVQQLESISVDLLVGEHATIRDQSNWVWTFKSKAMLCQRAMRALVKHQLYLEGMKDVFEEMVGHKAQKGKLFSLLEHFEICLEVRHAKDLNPGAREFVPGKLWETTQNCREAYYLFPTYLNQSEEVSERWGGDHLEDLHIRAYFSPEIPEGFFQRLMVKACSFYSAHWIAKVTCLLICSGKPLLIKENNQKGYSYIELRSRKPAQRTEFQFTWDFFMAIIFIIRKLSEEWPGLHMCMKAPCRTAECPAEFFWPDVDDKNTVTKEEIKTCGTCGHRFRTELLLPKVPSDLEVPQPPPPAHYYVTSYGTTSFGPSSIHVHRQSILDK